MISKANVLHAPFSSVDKMRALHDLLADQAMMCEYLPQCLENARSNPFVTLSAFLEAV